MSHKIEVYFPLDSIVIIQGAHLPNTNRQKLKEARDIVWNAISPIVKQLPEDFLTKAVDSRMDTLAKAKRQRSGASDSDESSDSSGGRKKRKRSPETFRVFVKGLGGMKRTYNVDSDTTTSDLAARIEARDGIPVDLQRLIFGGKQLEGMEVDDEHDVLLTEAGIGEYSTLYLVMRLRGS